MAFAMHTHVPLKIPRGELPQGDVLCNYCAAKCCQYFALNIDQPVDVEDWEFIRWFLLHGMTSLFMEEGDWYLLVHTECKHLQHDHRCGIYHDRPMICREYSTNECEYEDDYLYERYLETSEQVAEYMEVVVPRKRKQSIRSPKPELLPIL